MRIPECFPHSSPTVDRLAFEVEPATLAGGDVVLRQCLVDLASVCELLAEQLPRRAPRPRYITPRMPLRPFIRAIPWLVIAALTSGSTLSPAPAQAGVKQAPHLTGPLLERTGRSCESDRDEVVGLRSTICHYDFFADPALDGDPDRNYGAGWIQIAVEPLGGSCVTGARGSIRVQGTSLISRAPSRPSRPGPNTVQLRLATPHQALGSIKQRFRLARGITSSEVLRSPRGDRLRWGWQGRSRKDPIVLVIGIGSAIPITDDPFTLTEELIEFTTMRC